MKNIRAYFTIDTNGSDKVPKVLEDNVHCSNWCIKYHEEVGDSQIDKLSLASVISHVVNEYVISVVNYITYGLRD